MALDIYIKIQIQSEVGTGPKELSSKIGEGDDEKCGLSTTFIVPSFARAIPVLVALSG
jgi:hypothetical protein